MQAITALPKGTVSKLSASQALTDSSAVIKELVENALDARATTISVEISANCLDRIRVRDNGFGIRPEDRSLICKKYCTSKIRSLDDLNELGGRTLGFRGEALASAAELSSTVTIWTRIEGEEVAQMIEFNQKGSIVSQKAASQPTGTTVQIDSFLKAFPVRRQTAEKAPAQSMAKIRRMLQTFVFARPQIRFSLKILRAKDPKGDWAYAPNMHTFQDKDLKKMYFDALARIYGKMIPEKCRWIFSECLTNTSENMPVNSVDSTDNNCSSQFQINGIVVDAQCADPTALMSLGHFVSIDYRPMSCNQGILREVARYYRSCVRRVFSPSEVKRVLDPLLILSITCPRASYDVNVEPGKDDVLFYKPQNLLLAVQRLLDSHYGEVVSTSSESQPQKQTGNSPDFDKLLARTLNDPRGSSTKARTHEIGNETALLDDQSEQVSGPSALRQAPEADRDLEVTLEPNPEDDVTQDSSTVDTREGFVSEHGLLPKSHPLRRKFPSTGDGFGTGLHRMKHGASDTHTLGDITSTERSPSGGQHQTSEHSASPFDSASPKKHSSGSYAASLTLPQCWREPVSNRGHVGDSSFLPRNISHHSSYRSGQAASIISGSISLSSPDPDHLPTRQRRLSDTAIPFVSSPSPIHPDLALTLDYEHRKQKATLDYKKKLRKEKAADAADAARCMGEVADGTQRTLDSLFWFPKTRPSGVSPHQSRYQKAMIALQSSPKSPDSPSTNDGRISVVATPFSQPFARGKKAQRQLLSRAGEKFPVIDLIMPVSWTLGQVRREMRRCEDSDDYINQRTKNPDEVLGLGERGTRSVEWEARVRLILSDRFPGMEAAVAELPLEMNLQTGSSAKNG